LAADSPPFARDTSRTAAPKVATTSAVPSVEPSSHTTTSDGGSVCPSADSTAAATVRSAW
jgi:hypothetical protein